MGKVIKVIDLLNMIAKAEDLPRIIKYRRKKYYLYTKLDNLKWYWKKDTEGNWGDDLFIDVYGLNDEVEILDEEDEIDIQNIQKIDGDYLNGIIQSMNLWTDREKAIIKQQNIILEAVKQLDNKLKEK